MKRTLVSLLLAAVMVAAVLGVAAAAPPSTAAAEPGPSATGIKQVLKGTYPWGIALSVDRGGKRHVVAGRRNGELWYATDRSGSWTRQRILKGPAVRYSWAWALPSIAIDGNGRVHIAVVKAYPWDTPGGTDGIWYLTDKGRKRGSFGQKVRIAGDNTTDPSLRVVGRVRYLVFGTISFPVPGKETSPLYFKTDRSGAWKRERIAFHGFGPSLRVDARGRAHVAFGTPSGVRYSRARTKAGDFTKPKVISAGRPGGPSGASLVLDPAGRPHVVWPASAGGGRIWYTKRTSSGWRAPVPIGNGRRTQISMDANSRPHIVIGSNMVVHKWRTASGWQRSVVATDLSTSDTHGYYQGDVRIRAYGKRASIAWAPDRTGGGVWVARD